MTGVLIREEEAMWWQKHTERMHPPYADRGRDWSDAAMAKESQHGQQSPGAGKGQGRLFLFRFQSEQDSADPLISGSSLHTVREWVSVVVSHPSPNLPCLPSLNSHYTGSLGQLCVTEACNSNLFCYFLKIDSRFVSTWGTSTLPLGIFHPA